MRLIETRGHLSTFCFCLKSGQRTLCDAKDEGDEVKKWEFWLYKQAD